MSSSNAPITRGLDTIVVGTDFSALADQAVQAAARVAILVGAKRLHVAHIMAPPIDFVSLDAGQAEWRALMAQASDHARARLAAIDPGVPELNVTREFREGIPARELAEIATELGAGLVVVASHGRGGFRRFLLGSVSSALVRVATCPVLVIGEHRSASRPFNKVLAAVDLSPVSERVLSQAVRLAAPNGSVCAFSVREFYPFMPREDALLVPLPRPEDLAAIEHKVKEGVEALWGRVPHEGVETSVGLASLPSAAPAILEVAARGGYDLIVLGTSGHNTWQRAILGSTAGKVLSEATCPVLVVPHP